MRFYRIQEGEFVVCLAAMLGVVILGAPQGIVLAIAIAMLVLLVRSSRPADAVLGRVEGLQEFYDLGPDSVFQTLRAAVDGSEIPA